MNAKVRLPDAYMEIIKKESDKQCRELLDSLSEEHDAILLLALNECEGWKHVPFVRLMLKMKELKARLDGEAALLKCKTCDVSLNELKRRGIDLNRIYRDAGIND